MENSFVKNKKSACLLDYMRDTYMVEAIGMRLGRNIVKERGSMLEMR